MIFKMEVNMSQTTDSEIQKYDVFIDELLKSGTAGKKSKLTAKDITKKLRSKIQKAIKSGHSILEICEWLGKANAGIKGRSFYAHVSAIKHEIDGIQEKRKAKQQTQQKAVTKTEQKPQTVQQQTQQKPQQIQTNINRSTNSTTQQSQQTQTNVNRTTNNTTQQTSTNSNRTSNNSTQTQTINRTISATFGISGNLKDYAINNNTTKNNNAISSGTFNI